MEEDHHFQNLQSEMKVKPLLQKTKNKSTSKIIIIIITTTIMMNMICKIRMLMKVLCLKEILLKALNKSLKLIKTDKPMTMIPQQMLT